MFGWFRKWFSPSADFELRNAVEAVVTLLRADSAASDSVLLHALIERGLDESRANRVVQFLPIAFTRFLYRDRGVKFSKDYVILGPDGRPVSQQPVASEPAFREAWSHCERAAAGGAGDDYFIPIAARSGGYQAIQELQRQGRDLAGIMTGPPFMMG